VKELEARQINAGRGANALSFAATSTWRSLQEHHLWTEAVITRRT